MNPLVTLFYPKLFIYFDYDVAQSQEQWEKRGKDFAQHWDKTSL